MCAPSCLEFAARQLALEELKDKKVIEVGARDVNGGLRLSIERWAQPAEYIGIDIEDGPGVDVVCDVRDLTARFGRKSYDVVIATELIEHVSDWRCAISNMKNVCKKGGIILITTRSYGFRPHAYPYDFWRYEVNDMQDIFSDCEMLSIEADSHSPGVFVKARIPEDFVERDLKNVSLYSILLNKRVQDIPTPCAPCFQYRRMQLESRIWGRIRGVVTWMSNRSLQRRNDI